MPQTKSGDFDCDGCLTSDEDRTASIWILRFFRFGLRAAGLSGDPRIGVGGSLKYAGSNTVAAGLIDGPAPVIRALIPTLTERTTLKPREQSDRRSFADRSADPGCAPECRGRGRWAGALAALLCGFVYFGFGTQWTMRPRPSLYVHHILTAHAWLSGRAYVTATEIERQFMVNSLVRAGRPPAADASADALRDAFDEQLTDYLRSLGVAEKDIPIEVAGGLRRAYLDWVRVGDRYYAYWPPTPAAMMVPLVAVLGTDFSDVVFANVFGAVTVFAVFCTLIELRRFWPELSLHACLGLTLFYGLGTCHMYQASAGQVWLITQLSATLFLTIAIGIAFRAMGSDCELARHNQPSPYPLPDWERGNESRYGALRFAAGALALSLGVLSRSTILGTLPFFVGAIWMRSSSAPRPFRHFARTAAVFAAIIVMAIGVQLAFNQVRFGDPLDLGQGRLADEGGDARFSEEFKTHGRFDLHYMPRNVWHYFLNPTMREYPAYDPAHAGLTFDPDGNSLFLISPLFIYLFFCGKYGPGRFVVLALAGALPGLVALMLYHNTGWYQFGPRYLLDVLPFLLILTVSGMGGKLTRVSLVLISISFVINAWGTHRFILEQG